MSNGSQIPIVKNSKNGTIIRHREYLADIENTTAFTNRVFPINPGISKTFPYLSQIAPSFEEYMFRGLIFEYRSMSSDDIIQSGANSTGLGTVVMATEYDVQDENFPSKSEMENSQFAVSCKPSVSMIHPVECERKQVVMPHLFVRTTPTGALPSNADPRFYDLGNFQIATQGNPGTTGMGVIGELWVSYEVELFKPQKYSSGDLIPTDHFLVQVVPTVFQGPLLGLVRTANSTIGGTCTTVGAVSTYAFPANVGNGRYLVMWALEATTVNAATCKEVSFNTPINCALVGFFDNTAADQVHAPTALAVDTTEMMGSTVVDVNLSGATFNVTWSAAGADIPTGPGSVDFVVTQINPSTEVA